MARKTAILALGPFLPLTPQQVEVLEGSSSNDSPAHSLGVHPLPSPSDGGRHTTEARLPRPPRC
jgi:hypothetical protein